MKKVVIAGGSGFIGRALVSEFVAAGYEAVVLSRSARPVPGARVVTWDARSPQQQWVGELEGASAVVNLCGENVLQRWTPANLERIHESRIGTTRLIGAAITECKEPPAAWVNASAVGWYGDTGSRELSEASPAGDDTFGRLCEAWESEVDSASVPRTRKVKVRIGLVVGPGSPFFESLKKATTFFLGGPIGNGKQYMPWIHIKDLARLFVWAVESPVQGAINGTGPKPVTNADFMEAFRASLGRPPAPPVPEFAVRAACGAMGWEPSMFLGGTRAVPAIAVGNGFEFEFPTIEAALADLNADVPPAWQSGTVMA